MSVLRTGASVAAGLALTMAALGAQQPVTVEGKDITLRGCVGQANPAASAVQPPSMLVWTRGDMMLSAAAAVGADAPSPVGTNGVASQVFYWISDEKELAKHVGQQVEVTGKLGDFKKGEVEVKRQDDFTEIEFDLGGKEDKARIPTAWLDPSFQSGKDKQQIDIVARRIDVKDVKVLGPCDAR